MSLTGVKLHEIKSLKVTRGAIESNLNNKDSIKISQIPSENP
jgi:hypothetical protein